MTRGIVPETIIEDGRLYYRYTKPYMSIRQAFDKLESLFAEGLVSEGEFPVIRNKAIYIRGS